MGFIRFVGRRAAAVVVGAATIALFAPSAAGEADYRRPASHGRFWTPCFYVHSSMDDPIMLPGLPGASHLHDFFGNSTTNAGSTRTSMSSGRTRCAIQGDRSGYWAPAAYMHGVRQPAQRIRTYLENFRAHSRVRPFPAGLQMIGGNPDAKSPAESPHTFWSCGETTQKVAHPYACAGIGEGHVVAGVDFPSCWNGNGTTMDDVASPPAPRRPCPTAYPVALPTLSLRIHIAVVDPCAGKRPCGPNGSDANVALSFASGEYFTLHADFWNLWSPTVLRRLIRECLNAHKDCRQLVPSPTLPSAPELDASTSGARRVRLRWVVPDTGGPPVTGVGIYRSLRPAAENAFGSKPIAVVRHGTSFTDTHVRRGRTYHYRVVARNRVGTGELSNEASISTG